MKRLGNSFSKKNIRRTRVKMHKSGKHWVRTLISQIGWPAGSSSESKTTLQDLEKKHLRASNLIKGAFSVGALLGGVSVTENVFADNIENTSETTLTTLAEQDQVFLTVDHQEDSVSISEPLSTSESLSVSGSVSISESESTSLSESTSVSESLSESESVSTSESESESHSIWLLGNPSASETATLTTETSLSSDLESGGAVSLSQEVILEQLISETEILLIMGQQELAKSGDHTVLTEAISHAQRELEIAQSLLLRTPADSEELQSQVTKLQIVNAAIAGELLKTDSDGNLSHVMANSVSAPYAGYSVTDNVPSGSLPSDTTSGYYTSAVLTDTAGNYLVISLDTSNNVYVTSFAADGSQETRSQLSMTPTATTTAAGTFSVRSWTLSGAPRIRVSSSLGNVTMAWNYTNTNIGTTTSTFAINNLPVYVTQTTHHNYQDGSQAHEDVVQSGWTYSTYTTAPVTVSDGVVVSITGNAG